MKQGTVKEYDRTKGFGFVTSDDGEDYFVHVSGLREHLKQRGLMSGQRVLFDVDFGMKGDKAINVRLG
ncbi:MAG: cold-shock protein [Candidatus Marinimicrobia bacterium]|jgi:CspA family cold shock protein|nr:cold-shock protein [Candidatus Neomarinimicrobiota bacterium]MBT3938024.1 cold-shock protein [Candidatus Neomarinimicrobiota bacterium]MBT3961564.1 cold-shock protein [Candidatus Neomarinimicrobiota bacterium]MBT4382048.1 cold-shock protein [Candidatus Neomarinimicrobiota bacterium]MBT4636097.1 cold-shock protein [Candidatus Neomarinimicrobiota bacterium]|tara:strand:+ start:163 stop:366 length:204 start_codon:yes stop_codon:yes gene_type:complete